MLETAGADCRFTSLCTYVCALISSFEVGDAESKSSLSSAMLKVEILAKLESNLNSNYYIKKLQPKL